VQLENQNQDEQKRDGTEGKDKERRTGYGSVWNWSVPLITNPARMGP
jgi:hypothetical protein